MKNVSRARVAELVDAADSKSAGLTAVGVQVPALVPDKSAAYVLNVSRFLVCGRNAQKHVSFLMAWNHYCKYDWIIASTMPSRFKSASTVSISGRSSTKWDLRLMAIRRSHSKNVLLDRRNLLRSSGC